MNDRKNVVVGLFVLVGLLLLGGLIVWFEGVAVLIRGGYTVAGYLPSAVGVRSGKRVHQDGIEIGDVRDVATSQPERPGVWVHMRINPGVRIPTEAVFIAQRSTVGDLYLDFRTAVKPTGYLPTDGTATVEGRLKGPELLPEDLMSDFREAMKKFGQLDTILANLKELTEPRTAKDVDAGKQRNLWTTLEQFERTAKTAQDQLKKPTGEIGRLITTVRQAATDLRKTLAKADKAFETVSETGKTFQQAGKKADALIAKGDALIAKLSKDTDEVRKCFENLNGLVTDARGGKGTAGKLLTDDELHRALVTLVENLNTTADNFNRLVTMLREEGVFSKEK